MPGPAVWTRPKPVVDALAVALVRRAGLVATGLLTANRRSIKRARRQPAATADGLVALEADMLALGYQLGPRLRARLAAQPADELAVTGLGLLAALASAVGADVPHVPLFRNFPRRVPADTYELYVRRVFTLLCQEPEQPCVLCGLVGTVSPVAPCAHLVCAACWSAEDYSGCPLCHRRLSSGGPFLVVDPAVRDVTIPLPRRASVVELAEDVDRAVHQALALLLARRTPLTPQDRADLLLLLDRVGTAELSWLPPDIPVRETRALVLGRLAGDPALAERLPDLLARYADTATDVLRLLYVLHGGDAGLVTAPARRRSLPRPVRRVLLAHLDGLPLPALVDDLHRHRRAWLAMAENLHPFEQPARHPHAAAAFAALRGTTVDPATPLGRLLTGVADRYPTVLVAGGGRLRPSLWASRVEAAMRTGAVDEAVDLLAQRPGELIRRLVALAGRTTDPETLVVATARAARAAAPGVLIGALGAVRAATWPAESRLYFPRGGSARLWAEPDHRPRLAANLGGALDDALAGELRRRAAALPRAEVALLDAALADLVAPFSERTASAALVRLPRGSTQPLPSGRTVRLFLHWTEPAGTRVDLDLSVAMIDDAGEFVGWCDYTRLRFAGTAAVHSGDLTSAPAPLGASEFVDLDIPALRKRGIRYLAMVVFSYNDVPFDAMDDAFAGFMADPGRSGTPFEPKAVEQRFDLAGQVRIATPLVVDLRAGVLRWVDAVLGGTGGQHSIARYSRTLGRLTAAVDGHFAAGRRVGLWELACWHAAARSSTVLVRHRDGTLCAYRRGADESEAGFAARLSALGPADAAPAGSGARPDFAVLVRGDVPLAPGAQVYALYRSGLDAEQVCLVEAADLVGALAPLPPS